MRSSRSRPTPRGRPGTFSDRDRDRADAHHVVLSLIEDSVAGRESELVPTLSRRELSLALGVAAKMCAHFAAQSVQPLPGHEMDEVDVPGVIGTWVRQQRAIVESTFNEKEKESDDDN